MGSRPGWKTGQVRDCLLICGINRDRLADGDAVGIALKASVQVIVLCCAMVNAEAGADNCLSMECCWRPSEANARVDILVVRVRERRIPGAWRRVKGGGKRGVAGS